ncbi:hypothetical protein Tco_1052777 [Tanacetum coccineum]
MDDDLFTYEVEIANIPYDLRVDYDSKHETDNMGFDPSDIAFIEPIHMALPPGEQRHRFLRYEGMEYPDTDIADFEGRLARIYRREVHRVPVFNFGGLPDLMAEGLSGRMLMEHRDEACISVFTSSAWRRMLDIRLGRAGRRMSWRWFILALGLHTEEEMQMAEFGVYWAESARQIPDKGGLKDYLMGILSGGDFLRTAPSYTLIRDLILRLCHRLIACSNAGRSQAPEKVTVTYLFYLKGMDVDSVNVPYILARYLRFFAAVRQSGAHISGGKFAWVTMGPERQPVATVGSPAVAEDALIIDEGGQQRMAILKEDVYEIRQGLTEQQEVINAMAHDFSRRIRQRTGEASTSAAQQDQQQPDP